MEESGNIAKITLKKFLKLKEIEKGVNDVNLNKLKYIEIYHKIFSKKILK